MTALQMAGLFLGGVIGDRTDKRTICTLLSAPAVVDRSNLGADHQVIAFAVAHGLAWE